MRKQLLFLLIIGFSIKGFPQFGGGSTYDFLNLASSARVNSLGGSQVGIIDSSELSLSFYNPACLKPLAHNQLSLNYINFVSDINIGYVSYARHYNHIGTFAAGIQYTNYGKFKEALENGTLTGSNFTAADYALTLIYSRNIWKNFSAGINLKPIYSAYETYKSFGIAVDLGISYIDSAGLFSAGLVLNNIGTQITTYYDGGEREPLPFNIQLGFSQRLNHAPFRFSATLTRLQNWNLTDKSTWDYDQSDEKDYVSGSSDNVVRQFMRHTILGVEFIPSKNFSLGIGYNYQRKRELSVSNVSDEVGILDNAAGLSGGVNVKISKFRISYAVF
ncbi:MAG TPA: type IX secretion system protein PorQ, partial [Prolixibacteraceae bacterium]|nr:type IX secretion system protein PorQ [Prolixibacteraceae bacterium]